MRWTPISDDVQTIPIAQVVREEQRHRGVREKVSVPACTTYIPGKFRQKQARLDVRDIVERDPSDIQMSKPNKIHPRYGKDRHRPSNMVQREDRQHSRL